MPIISYEQLKSIASKMVQALGVLRSEAEIIGEYAVQADLLGHESHGIFNLLYYIEMALNGELDPHAKIEIEKERENIAILNGNRCFGGLAGEKAMRIAIKKATDHDIGTVAVRNSGFIGALAPYSMMALQHDMIGITVVNANAHGVAPYGGTAPRFGANAISYAIPAGKEKPIILDMATTWRAGSVIRLMGLREEKIPKGWIIDSEGRPTTDYNSLGAMSPMGYKGYSLCLVFDMLAGALSGHGTANPTSVPGPGNGIFMQAINVGSFQPIAKFKAMVDETIRYVKSSPPAPGVREVLIPGERAQREQERMLREGIFVEEKIWLQVEKLSKQLGLDISLLM